MRYEVEIKQERRGKRDIEHRAPMATLLLKGRSGRLGRGGKKHNHPIQDKTPSRSQLPSSIWLVVLFIVVVVVSQLTRPVVIFRITLVSSHIHLILEHSRRGSTSGPYSW